MEISTPLGIVLGFGMLLAGYILEEGALGALIGISPALIVFGGTLGALTVSFTLKEIFSLPHLLMKSMTRTKGDDESKKLIDKLFSIAEKARREGVLSIESDLQGELSDVKYDPLLRNGLRLTVDGTEPELVKHILENQIVVFEEQRKKEASIFDAAGGFSPTMGIIGTVMGLIKVLGSLEDPSELGPAVALAFIATLYGVCFANLFWLPIGAKLKLKAKLEVVQKELIVEGILSIQSGENPRLVKERLEVYLGK